MKKMKCQLCGYQWQSRKARPVACPRCKRYDWQRVKPKHENETERVA